MHKSLAVDLGLITYDDQRLTDLELAIVKRAKQHDANTFYRLRSVPGVGEILALMLLYAVHDIHRFPRVQDFVSYARLVKGAKASAGKRPGTSGTNIGNAYRKWAFSEAAGLVLRHHPVGQKCLATLAHKPGQGKALMILAQKRARAVYDLLKRTTMFTMDVHKLAVRLRGGMRPQAYAYPAAMRATRDLLRRRMHLRRQRAAL